MSSEPHSHHSADAHSAVVHADNFQMEASRWNTGRNVLMFAALLSILACIAGYVLYPDRFFRSWMVAFTFTSAIGLGAFFFVMAQYLSGSAWSVTVRRIMENIMVTLPMGAILFIPVALGLNYLYSWTDPNVVASSEALRAKSGYITEKWFLIRTYGCFALWSLWILNIYHQSTKQDVQRSARQMHIISAWSAPGLFLAVVVGSLAAFDWLMSLQPAWYSTIFGLYYLADACLA